MLSSFVPTRHVVWGGGHEPGHVPSAVPGATTCPRSNLHKGLEIWWRCCLPSLRDSWFAGYGIPTTEVVGYSLSSLTGLNLGAAQIPFSFVSDGTRGLRDTGVPTTKVVGYYLPSLTGLNLGAAQIPFSFVPGGRTVGAPLISGLVSRRLTFGSFGVVQ